MGSKYYLVFDGMTWPNPDSIYDLIQLMQSTGVNDNVGYIVSSYLCAYQQMFISNKKDRDNIISKIKQLKKEVN
jgi:hypothetical protein